MTTEEAIKILERIQDPEPYEPQITKRAYDALQMAVDALKKQIAKKPKLKRDYNDWKLYSCPNCRYIEHSFGRYCCACGQALDWSKYETN